MASVNKRKWTHKGVTKEAWVVRYKDKCGAHRSRQFDAKKDADAYKRRVENEIEAGTHVARSETRTVADAAAEYLERLERKLSLGEIGPKHVEGAETFIEKINAALGAVKLTDLRWQDVEKFSGKLRATRSDFTGRIYKNGTVRSVLSCFSAVVDHAMRRGYCARNPVREARGEIGSMPVARIATLSSDQARSIFAALEQGTPGVREYDRRRTRALVYLAACCGLRRGEIMALTADCFDFNRGALLVYRSLTDRDVLKEPKSASGRRVVPLPSAVAIAVRAYMEVARPNDRGLLFRTRDGKAIRGRDFHRWWRAILARAGVVPPEGGEWHHFHALRHFAGSAWLDGGVPLADVSTLLGHADPQITARIYSHAIVEPMFRAPALEACSVALLPPIAQGVRTAA